MKPSKVGSTQRFGLGHPNWVAQRDIQSSETSKKWSRGPNARTVEIDIIQVLAYRLIFLTYPPTHWHSFSSYSDQEGPRFAKHIHDSSRLKRSFL